MRSAQSAFSFDPLANPSFSHEAALACSSESRFCAMYSGFSPQPASSSERTR